MLSKVGRSFGVLRGALASELRGGAGVPLATKLELWRRGFKSTSYLLFDLARNDPRDYVSDLDTSRARRINGAFSRILKDKLLFEAMFRPFAEVPEIVAVIERGQVFALREVRARGGAELLCELAGDAGLILKPSSGNKGRGVLGLSLVGGEPHLNAAPLSRDALQETLAGLDGYLVTRRVQQAAYAESIFGGSSNTVRVITMRDPDTQEVFIPAAMHRFGTARTVPTDNFQTGGLSAPLDLEAGTLGQAVRHPSVTGGQLQWRGDHPDTGAAITGVRVPRWDEVKAAVTRVVQRYAFLRYVGWDVLVTETGVCLIEGNHNINLGLQVHGPLLKDPRVRRFFEHHGVIPRGR